MLEQHLKEWSVAQPRPLRRLPGQMARVGEWPEEITQEAAAVEDKMVEIMLDFESSRRPIGVFLSTPSPLQPPPEPPEIVEEWTMEESTQEAAAMEEDMNKFLDHFESSRRPTDAFLPTPPPLTTRQNPTPVQQQIFPENDGWDSLEAAVVALDPDVVCQRPPPGVPGLLGMGEGLMNGRREGGGGLAPREVGESSERGTSVNRPIRKFSFRRITDPVRKEKIRKAVRLMFPSSDDSSSD